MFCTLRAVPGDPVEALLGEQAVEVDKARLRACLDLDQPLYVQYGRFFADLADGSLGHLCDERSVTVASKIAAVLPYTIELALTSMLVALVLAVPFGVIAAMRRGTWVDGAIALVSMLGLAMPNFWLGPMLLVAFASLTRWYPTELLGPPTSIREIVLPAVTLGTALAAKLTRMTRSSVLESASEDYVRTAFAKGLRRWEVWSGHILRTALTPVMTIAGLQLGALLTGAIIVEKVFARPGVGSLLLEAVEMRNYRMVQGCVLLIAVTYVTVNLLTDLLYTLADPRVRLDGEP